MEIVSARAFPLPSPPPVGEGDKGFLRKFHDNYQLSKVKLFCSKYFLHKIKYPLELAKLRGDTTISSGFCFFEPVCPGG